MSTTLLLISMFYTWTRHRRVIQLVYTSLLRLNVKHHRFICLNLKLAGFVRLTPLYAYRQRFRRPTAAYYHYTVLKCYGGKNISLVVMYTFTFTHLYAHTQFKYTMYRISTVGPDRRRLRRTRKPSRPRPSGATTFYRATVTGFLTRRAYYYNIVTTQM